jgi:hypothetical protein
VDVSPLGDAAAVERASERTLQAAAGDGSSVVREAMPQAVACRRGE